MNKYEKWYKSITARGQIRQLASYSETHHILPESLNGADTSENKTQLTAREHFICHWLLTKLYPTGEAHWKMVNALRMMRAENPRQKRYSTKITGRVYAKLKEEYSNLQSIKVSGSNNPMYGDKFYRSEEGIRRQKEAITGDKNGAKTLESRDKISKSKLGKKRAEFSDEWKNALSKNHKSKQPGFNGALSDETKQKMREKAIGRKQSAETIQKKADAIRGSKREKKLCPHCQTHIAVNTYARWHGDNCKYKKEEV